MSQQEILNKVQSLMGLTDREFQDYCQSSDCVRRELYGWHVVCGVIECRPDYSVRVQFDTYPWTDWYSSPELAVKALYASRREF